MLKKIFALTTSLLVGAAGSFFILDPVQYADQTQKSLLQNYTDVYCANHVYPNTSRDFHMGEAAALSRIVVQSGLSTLTAMELAKCQLGLLNK